MLWKSEIILLYVTFRDKINILELTGSLILILDQQRTQNLNKMSEKEMCELSQTYLLQVYIRLLLMVTLSVQEHITKMWLLSSTLWNCII